MLPAAVVSASVHSTCLLQQAAPCLALCKRISMCRSHHSAAWRRQTSSCSPTNCSSHPNPNLIAATKAAQTAQVSAGTHSSPVIHLAGISPISLSHQQAASLLPGLYTVVQAPGSIAGLAVACHKQPQQLLQQHRTFWNTPRTLYSQTTGNQHGEAPLAAVDSPSQQQQQQQQVVTSASEAASSFISATPAATAAAPATVGVAAGTPAGAAASAAAAAAAAASVGGVLAGGPTGPLSEYTMRQVSKHASDETCWIVVNGKVYDVTSYIDDHPGGAESILLNAGVDCTEEFMGVHSQEAKELLEKFLIGTVKAGTKKPKPQPAVVTSAAAAALLKEQPVLLTDPREKYALPLAQKKQLNHDTFFMRFALPGPQQQLGLPCGKHVFLSADIGGETVVRAYTPVSGDRDLGVLDFLIKVYWAGVHPLYPQGGKMTQYLAAMKEGDTIDVKGPYGKFSYEGQGEYTLNRVPGQARYLSMISGGSGVTPCYSVLREVLRDPQDQTRCALIYANKHEEDIWLKEELDTMARDNPDRFHLWYVVEEPGTPPTPFKVVTAPSPTAAAAAGSSSSVPNVRWTYSKGYITHDMMAQHLLPPQPVGPAVVAGQQQQAGSLALMCGPPGMLEHVVVPGLTAMGYSPEQMVLF